MISRFEVVIDSAQRVAWPGGGGFQPVELRVDGRPLIELVREAERALAPAEGLEPGAYLGLPESAVIAPSRELLDRPDPPGFELDDDDWRRHATTLLGCNCGVTECWFIIARVELEPAIVRWSSFAQFHRASWHYDLGPFEFERAQYEHALAHPIRR